MTIPPQDREVCLRVLQAIADCPSVINDDDRLKTLIAKIHTEGKRGARSASRQTRRDADRSLVAHTGMVQAQSTSVPTPALSDGASATPHAPDVLRNEIPCYICKQAFRELHPFYHRLCPACAALNFGKREQRADMAGRTALVTGGRVKIGYQTALRLLRDGARVIVTTRFTADAARRWAREPDYFAWRDRLQIYGLDLRHIGQVEAFAQHLLGTETTLDVLINNAAQTIRRPREFYQHLLDDQDPIYPRLEDDAALTHSLSTLRGDFPLGQYDADGQQIDARSVNSWRLRLGEVSPQEMLEVQLVNAVAPFVLNSRLKPLLLQSPFSRRFIVNVSAMEGQFGRVGKTVYHPHTNMAKAALNMMTRTAAADYARDQIYMNSVDTGWITDENPLPQKERMRMERGFFTPLDLHDGVSRVLAPVYDGLSGDTPLFGHFLKDYVPHPW